MLKVEVVDAGQLERGLAFQRKHQVGELPRGQVQLRRAPQDADAVVVAQSGKIYFSDASTRFGPAKWGSTYEAAVLDIIEQSATGRTPFSGSG